MSYSRAWSPWSRSRPPSGHDLTSPFEANSSAGADNSAGDRGLPGGSGFGVSGSARASFGSPNSDPSSMCSHHNSSAWSAPRGAAIGRRSSARFI